MALGAQVGAVLRMIMREGSIMLVSGVSIGLLLAIATAKILSGLLYGVRALDPIAFTVAPLVLTIAALIATYLPARRATRVDPVQAFRSEQTYDQTHKSRPCLAACEGKVFLRLARHQPGSRRRRLRLRDGTFRRGQIDIVTHPWHARSRVAG